MEISRMRHESGIASSKTAIIVGNLGSFQVVVTALYGLEVTRNYITHSELNGIKLCGTIQEVANHLECDYYELVDGLYKFPDWDEE